MIKCPQFRAVNWQTPPYVRDVIAVRSAKMSSDPSTEHLLNPQNIMSDKNQIIVAFDLYGTLLSTESIAKELSRHFGESKAATVAASWRRYQLEYTWRLNSMSTPTQTPPL